MPAPSPHAARPRMLRALALLLAALALAAVAAGCERRSQDAPAGDEPAASLRITADHGAELLHAAPVPAGQSVMRALRGAVEVDTAYAGGFVAGMLGRRSDIGGQRDWFLFVNGILSPVGARDVELADGDAVWWDHRPWGAVMDPWAVVGSWPAPFTAPAPAVFAEEPLAAALEEAGAATTADETAPWRVRAGAGLTAWPEGDAIVALDAAAGRPAPVPGAGAVIAAVPTAALPEHGVLVVVAGVDEEAAAAAAAALADDPALVRDAYALVLDRAGRPLRAGGRAAP